MSRCTQEQLSLQEMLLGHTDLAQLCQFAVENQSFFLLLVVFDYIIVRITEFHCITF